MQPDGKILLGGAFTNVNGTTRARLARLNADGAVESAFVPGLSGPEIRSLVLQPDGKILIGGVLNSVGGVPRRNIARLTADASLDSFYPAGTPGGANIAVRAISLQSDGKVLIGGDFTSVGVVARSYVARLLDSSPPPNSPPDAVDDVVATDEDTAVTFNVLANDTDVDGDPLSVSGFTQPINMASALFGWTPLFNYAWFEVCTSSNPHPDSIPTLTRIINSCRGTVYCYKETGAALNDLNGTERDAVGNYLTELNQAPDDPTPFHFCHVLQNGGYEVPAAKRPATRSLPAPGSVNVNTPIVWRPVNPNVRIAN